MLNKNKAEQNKQSVLFPSVCHLDWNFFCAKAEDLLASLGRRILWWVKGEKSAKTSKKNAQSTHINRCKNVPRQRFPIPKLSIERLMMAQSCSRGWCCCLCRLFAARLTNLLNDFLGRQQLSGESASAEDYSKLKAKANKHEGIYMATINHILCWSSCSCCYATNAIKRQA